MVSDTRFPMLCAITRAQHFAWRQAVAESAPGIDAASVVDRMWEITGRQTAESYLRRIDRARPIAPQVAALGVDLRVETVEALPRGEPSCRRLLYYSARTCTLSATIPTADEAALRRHIAPPPSPFGCGGAAMWVEEPGAARP